MRGARLPDRAPPVSDPRAPPTARGRAGGARHLRALGGNVPDGYVGADAAQGAGAHRPARERRRRAWGRARDGMMLIDRTEAPGSAEEEPSIAMSTAAADPESTEYTIDELASTARVPSRTIRFYQSRGALMPPEIRGRV